MNIRDSGIGRSLDIIMYVLYSDDQKFIKDMMVQVVNEVANENECNELLLILQHKDNPLLYKCLFFLLLDFQPSFRHWVLQNSNSIGLQKLCPDKALRFLRTLREDIVPNFLVNETQRLDDMERIIKVEYIRS